MELRDYLLVIRGRWLSIALTTALGLGTAVVVNAIAPRTYESTAQVFVALSNGGGEAGSIYSGALFAQQRVQSYTKIVDSPQVLEPAIDALDLDTSVDTLAAQVSASSPIETVLINVSARAGSASEAAAIANAVSLQLGKVIERIETPQGQATSPVKVTLTNAAQPPMAPVSPRTTTNLILGLLIGLGLGIGQALLRESLDTSVKSVDELSETAGANPLGLIAFDADAKRSPLVALDQTSVRAEAFRSIRTNLQYVDVDDPPRVIAVTSALPAEGKTTSALNLAITMAQAGQQVALVETDLRRPKTSEYLGIEAAVGLTDVLAGQVELDSALLQWNRGMLTVLAAGRVPPNPSELLASHQFAAVIANLRAGFDAVIVDATPLLPVTDGAIAARVADGALLVVRFGSTTRDQIAHAIDALERVDARLLGTILNFVPGKRRGYGYGYYGQAYRDNELQVSHTPTTANPGKGAGASPPYAAKS